jgi:hypothetical protein
MSWDTLPRASWGSANAPSAIAFLQEHPISREPQMQINVYRGELTLLDSFACSVVTVVGRATAQEIAELSDDALDETARQVWRVACSMMRTRPIPPASKRPGGAP